MKQLIRRFLTKLFGYLPDNLILIIIKIYNNSLFKNNLDLFFIFRRSADVGIVSNILVILGHINFLSKFKIPLYVDLKFFYNRLHHISYKKRNNYWNNYFYQPFNKKDLKKKSSSLIFFSDFISRKQFSNKNFLKNIKNFTSLFKSYIKLKKNTISYINKKISRVIKPKDKVLGVCIRDSYSKFKYHPIQPDLKMILQDINELLQLYPINKILIVCDNFNKITEIKKIYGSKVVYIKRPRIKYTENNFKNKNTLLEFHKFSKTYTSHNKTLDYLSEIYALSRCQHLISAINGATCASLLINAGKYKTTKIYNLGVH
jgi:hypothetical protein